MNNEPETLSTLVQDLEQNPLLFKGGVGKAHEYLLSRKFSLQGCVGLYSYEDLKTRWVMSEDWVLLIQNLMTLTPFSPEVLSTLERFLSSCVHAICPINLNIDLEELWAQVDSDALMEDTYVIEEIYPSFELRVEEYPARITMEDLKSCLNVLIDQEILTVGSSSSRIKSLSTDPEGGLLIRFVAD